MNRTAPALLAVLLAGCFSYKFQEAPEYFDAQPVDPEAVLVFEMPPKTKPYTSIGTVSVVSNGAALSPEISSDMERVLRELKKAAGAYGCNAIIMSQLDQMWGVQNNGMRGTCIVWK